MSFQSAFSTHRVWSDKETESLTQWAQLNKATVYKVSDASEKISDNVALLGQKELAHVAGHFQW